ncbi:hypothetical protein HYALB_00011713 [Hymenoscyphus albidus]|uniref:Methyltransferase domain-containing protein n=1 Tax=Hymenoscyphus albidus TaxID=595503 RepID=A0A9N9Q2U8_9HELO|nr:hypothetical protein HYALB_00011713 [Hymenoscyphus albidus]
MTAISRSQYEDFAPKYDLIENAPSYKLEYQLIKAALGDCTGLSVLDLGGGSGLHARQAIDAGASKVDVVDVSPSMLEIGKSIEASLGRTESIAWHIADVSRDISSQDISTSLLGPGEYDVVMVNWTFDHAETLDDLRGMWANVALYLKPSGRFIGVRTCGKGLRAAYSRGGNGKYGVTLTNMEDIANGVRFKVSFLVADKVVVELDATSMEDSYALVDEIPRQLGIVDFEIVPYEKMAIVKADHEYWKEFLDEPNLVVVKARKG